MNPPPERPAESPQAAPVALRRQRLKHLLTSPAVVWALIGGIVFCGLLLYQLHVPAWVEAPVKGLSALVAGLFALFGFKWDKELLGGIGAGGIHRGLIVTTLVLVLSAIIAALWLERNNYTIVRALPGSEIRVNDVFVKKVLPDHRSSSLSFVEVRLPLKWGSHTFSLTNPPLLPGNVEAVRENVGFEFCFLTREDRRPDSERPLAKSDDRRVQGSNRIAPLASSGIAVDADDVAGAVMAGKLVSFLNGTWRTVVGSGNDNDGVSVDDQSPALFTVTAHRRCDEILYKIVSTQNPKRTMAGIFPATFGDGNSTGSAETQAPAANSRTTQSRKFLENFTLLLQRDMADEDLAAWLLAKLSDRRESYADVLAAELANFPGDVARRAAEAAEALTRQSGNGACSWDQQKLPPEVSRKVGEITEALAPFSKDSPQIQQLRATVASSESLTRQDLAILTEAADAVPQQNSSPESRPGRVYLHIADKVQRPIMEEVQRQLVQLPGTPLRVPGIQNVSGRAFIPAVTEVRYFDRIAEDSGKIAAEIANVLNRSGAVNAVAVYVAPSDRDRANSVDITTHFEVWASATDFLSPN